MQKVLLVYNGNYADEFDYVASAVVERSEWPSSITDPILEGIDLDYEHERYFGTNESVFVSVREVIEDTEIVLLETEREVMIVDKLNGTFDGVFDIVFNALYEKETKQREARNIARWQTLTDEQRAAYVDVFNLRKATPFKTHKEEYERLGDRSESFWKEHGFEGYRISPENLTK